MSLISGNESRIFAKGVIGNVRKAQEDCHGWKLGTPNGDLFVVCDGMGGHVGGAMASKIAVESIIEHISKEQYATPVEALDGALQFANMQILGYTTDHPELKGMGTTACIVLMQGDGVWIAHVGDSRIYLYLGNERQLHRITKDHSYVQTLVDAGEITDDEAEHHPNKNRIMKALGIKPELHPTFNFENKPIHPKNGDVFLICSDGMSGMIPDSTIGRTLGESMDLHQKGERLIELAMIGETVQPGGQDNCTLELIEVDDSPWTKSEFMSYNPKPTMQQAPVNLTSDSSKPESPKQVKPHPKSNGRAIKIVAIAAAALIVVTVLAIFVPPAIRSNNIKKAKVELSELKKKYTEADEKYKGAEKHKKDVERDYDRLKKESTPVVEKQKEHDKAIKDAKISLDFAIDAMKKANKGRSEAWEAYHLKAKDFDKKYAKTTQNNNRNETNTNIIGDTEYYE